MSKNYTDQTITIKNNHYIIQDYKDGELYGKGYIIKKYESYRI